MIKLLLYFVANDTITIQIKCKNIKKTRRKFAGILNNKLRHIGARTSSQATKTSVIMPCQARSKLCTLSSSWHPAGQEMPLILQISSDGTMALRCTNKIRSQAKYAHTRCHNNLQIWSGGTTTKQRARISAYGVFFKSGIEKLERTYTCSHQWISLSIMPSY